MNNDLISRDALKHAINNIVDEEIEIDEKWAKGLKYSFKIIDNAPAVDAYPFEQVQELIKLNQQFAQEIENLKRLQGEWIITGEEQGAFNMIYKIRKCSKCGWEHSLVIPDNFCPKCGAEMKGGAEE